MTEATRLRHFIGGRWRDSESESWIADVNPSNSRDVVAQVPRGTPHDVDAAVNAASAAFDGWRATTGPARSELLYAWAATIGARSEELAQLIAREVGKPIGESRGEVARCVTILRYFAGEAVRATGELIPAHAPGALQFSMHQPLGVVALITPWNFPVAIALWKAAPALAFGNTVVLKPAEAASQCAMVLAECAALAGLPAGVFNVLLGAGDSVGSALIASPGVHAVSFTGSGAIGARVAAAATARNIRYQTEMGGKNVAIVMPDADLRLAATMAAGGAMRYAGQKCTATSRVIVAREVENAFLEQLCAQVAALPLGLVTDAATAIGPVISAQSRTSIRQVLDTIDAERIYVGEVPATADFADGFFTAPTIIRGAASDSVLAQRELFGPVLASFVADDLDHAIALANDTPYGLSASLFTRDLRSALRYVDRIDAGMVRVNGDTNGVDPHAPFGGMKGSSSGTREQGTAAREFYTEIKTVQINP